MRVTLFEELAKRPVPINREIAFGAYSENKTWYWENVISKIAVNLSDERANEPLVDCQSIGLLTKNYYKSIKTLSAPIAPRDVDKIMLRKGIASDLVKVDQFLAAFGFRVLLMSGHRSKSLQQAIVATATAERGPEFAKQMFANPNVYVPHASGGAFDIELWDVEKETMLATKVANSSIAWHALELEDALGDDAKVVRGNRRIIYHLLCSEVVVSRDRSFVSHPFEYWHYGRNERLSAFFEGQRGITHDVYYDEVEA